MRNLGLGDGNGDGDGQVKEESCRIFGEMTAEFRSSSSIIAR